MAVKREILYVGVGRCVIAVDGRTGEEMWRTKLPHTGSSVVTLLLKEGCLYVGHCGRAYGLDARTGSILWENGLRGTGWGPVLAVMEGAHGCTPQGTVAGYAEIEKRRRAAAAGGACGATS
jgi:outer membrane protein assembly factor BamB